MSLYNHSLMLTLQQCQGASLFIADENCLDFPFEQLTKSTRVISNRFDVHTAASAAGLQSDFSDYDFSNLKAPGTDNVVYRISKEKPAVHHIANQSYAALNPGGTLWLLGGKQEGIKTFAKTISSLFGSPADIRKEGQTYCVQVKKNTRGNTPLDDKDYNRLREIFILDDKPVMSKPGLFGWNKIDMGSELLASQLGTFLSQANNETRTVLDLGCGYGYLSLMAAQHGAFEITATDNCAAALTACDENFRLHDIAGRVVAGDCGSNLTGAFDAILCNPPFHQGFQQDRKLTDKFLSNTSRLLAKQGRALFVVNQFVPLESLARAFFKSVDVPASTKSFKLVLLHH